MQALLDGNHFYVSCERVFRSSPHDRPVIVLSNNDGCAIARSTEGCTGCAQYGRSIRLRRLPRRL